MLGHDHAEQSHDSFRISPSGLGAGWFWWTIFSEIHYYCLVRLYWFGIKKKKKRKKPSKLWIKIMSRRILIDWLIDNQEKISRYIYDKSISTIHRQLSWRSTPTKMIVIIRNWNSHRLNCDWFFFPISILSKSIQYSRRESLLDEKVQPNRL